jgi:serine/threonine-protein kinase
MGSAEGSSRYNVRKQADDPLVGTVVNGKYRVASIVATGGMGRIYKAEQLPLGRTVALKVLNPQYTASSDDDAFQKRFFLEASILSKLQHPNIVTVFDYGRIDGTDPEAYFMAMEFLAGDTLHRRLNQCGPLSPHEAIGLARQLARGLREAHAHDVVHRDLKPSNVMLIPQEDGSELVKIVDFGLVKVLTDDSDHVTKEGTFLGSPRYMSPEQIAHGRVDLRTDIYSLGVILYQVLTGTLPFDSDHAVQTLMAHLHNPVPWMAENAPGVQVPAALENFVRRCLEKNPAQRPASMEEFTREITELEAALGMTSGVGLAFDYDTGSGSRKPLQQPIPEIRTGPQARSGSGDRLALEPLEQPTIATPPPFSRSRTITRYALMAAGVLVVGAAAVVLWMNRAVPADPTPAASVEPARGSFTLTIDSSPGGAEVFEGDALRGSTPMVISLENSVLRQQATRFVVRKEGFQPYSLVQGPSQENVRMVAALVPLPAAVPSAPPPDAANTGRVPVTRVPGKLPGKTDPAKPPDSDIRLHR